MKKKFLIAACALMMIVSGCGKEAADEGSIFEKEPIAASADEDFTQQIKNEISEIAAAGSLTDELVKVNELYSKYDDLRMNAETQTEMNTAAKWGTLVWETEVESLMERISNHENKSAVEQIKPTYDDWSSKVDAMAEKMAYIYEGGSIQGMIIMDNKRILCRNEAYGLASTLADLNGEATFMLPERDPYGYYGDFASGDYLILTEGMESGSYNILVSINGKGEITGMGEATGDESLSFTGDDMVTTGEITYSNFGAEFSVTEADGTVVNSGDYYEFTFHY